MLGPFRGQLQLVARTLRLDLRGVLRVDGLELALLALDLDPELGLAACPLGCQDLVEALAFALDCLGATRTLGFDGLLRARQVSVELLLMAAALRVDRAACASALRVELLRPARSLRLELTLELRAQCLEGFRGCRSADLGLVALLLKR